MANNSIDGVVHLEPDRPYAGTGQGRRRDAQQRLVERLRGVKSVVGAAPPPFSVDADEFQLAVIQSPARTIRMIAPAGSGKTQTIVNRALTRIAAGVRPERILVLTFDNSAVASILEKFTTSGDERHAVNVSTLNAFGYGLLRQHFPDLHGRVSDDRDRRFRFRRLRRALAAEDAEIEGSLPVSLKDNFFVQLFGLLKDALIDPRDFDEDELAETLMESRSAATLFEDPEDNDLVDNVIEAVQRLFVALDRDLQENKLLDFEDQKLRALVALREHAGVASAVQARFDEVIVDEFQDINRLDFALIELVARKATLVVTGDDDQSIYGFRGTTPDFMIDLDHHLGRPIESRVLEINYRCPPNVVRHAVQLIEHNERRLAKTQIAHQTELADIAVVGSISSGLESRMLLDYMSRLIDGGVRPHDVAILYRTNAQSLPLQVELILANIPYQVRAEDNILTNEVLERLIAVLRVRSAIRRGIEPKSDDAVAVIRGYFRTLKQAEADELRRLLREEGFIDALERGRVNEVVPKAASGRLKESVRMLVGTTSLQAAMTVIADRFKGMAGMVGSLEEAVEGGVPLAEVSEIAANFDDPDEFVETMERAIKRATTTSAGEDPRGVQLLTYFRSKGRQWHTVILVSCNEGLIPHRRAQLEEERRLFYVALTRASKNLLVSYVDQAVSSRTTPSRFLYEAGLLEPPASTVQPPPPTHQSREEPDWRIGLFVSATDPIMYRLDPDGSIVTSSGVAVSEPTIEKWKGLPRWATGAEASHPQARFTLPPLFKLADLLVQLGRRPVTGAKFRERAEMTIARYALRHVDPAQVEPTSRPARGPTPPPLTQSPIASSPSGESAEHSRESLRQPTVIVCAEAVADPGSGYRWITGKHIYLEGNGFRLMARLSVDHGKVGLVLPAADKVADPRMRRCLIWLEPRLRDLGSIGCNEQVSRFRALLARTVDFRRSDSRGWTV